MLLRGTETRRHFPVRRSHFLCLRPASSSFRLGRRFVGTDVQGSKAPVPRRRPIRLVGLDFLFQLREDPISLCFPNAGPPVYSARSVGCRWWDECGSGRPTPSSLTPQSSRRSSSFRWCGRVRTRVLSSEARCGRSRRLDSGAPVGLRGSFSWSWSAPAALPSCSFGGRRCCTSPAPYCFMGPCWPCSFRGRRGTTPGVAVRVFWRR
jgi:hypothetical protein